MSIPYGIKQKSIIHDRMIGSALHPPWHFLDHMAYGKGVRSRHMEGLKRCNYKYVHTRDKHHFMVYGFSYSEVAK